MVLLALVPSAAFAYREPRAYVQPPSGWGCSGPCHRNADGSILSFDDPAVHADCESCHAPYTHGLTDWQGFPFSGAGLTGPHGSYSVTTDRCDTCHNIHGGTGATFKLQPGATVADTCFACHDGTGGQGVYGAIKARTGVNPTGTHPVVSTSTVPGGNALTGQSSTVAFKGSGGKLTCTDCHSAHGNDLVAPFKGDRRRTVMGKVTGITSRLLKKRPTGSAVSVSVYGSDWCLTCHAGRASGGAVHNHPVDSLQTRADPFNYSKIVVSDHWIDGYLTDRAGTYGSLGGYELYDGGNSSNTQPSHNGDVARSNRGFLMPFPRYPLQVGHAPICQQCHEDTRDPGSLTADGSSAIVKDSYAAVDSADGVTSTLVPGALDNPRFQNFPHETENDKMLIETDDDLCLNCHPASQLP